MKKESLLDKLKKYKELYSVIAFFIALVISSIWIIFQTYQDVLDKYEELLVTNKTTQQMALKSVIWNDEIPLAERASACDVYLGAGFNSMTKKHCESILKE